MPTNARALCADLVGAARLSDPRLPSSRRIAMQILRKAAKTAPATVTMMEIAMRAAIVASEHFRAAIAPRLAQIPSPRLWLVGWAWLGRPDHQSYSACRFTTERLT